ncbi:TetR/AcrR family transcriptional regulator [Brevibacterium album]|uniref:TetR/AcrR family transcriptional regulator n=1 Tax=Brevibacterium album TaxID=417948 RepID=UPI0004168C77|nr:TetR/AcrR family transcriptional regulator [Brevibacterium album]
MSEQNPVSEQNPLAPSLQLLWHGLPESDRGPRPRLTLAQIVEAAVVLADGEGLEALSMRALARELGVGTMSLYRYVPSKTELLNLMLDAVVADPADGHPAAETAAVPAAGDADTHWRRSLEEAAQSARRLYLAHPWTMQATWMRPVLGPNALTGLDRRLAGLRGLPMSDQEKMGILSAVDSYVMGALRQEIQWQSAAEDSGMTDDEFWRHQIPALSAAMASGRFPEMAQLSDDTFDLTWEDDFDFGLALLLDGVEQTVARRRAVGNEDC